MCDIKYEAMDPDSLYYLYIKVEEHLINIEYIHIKKEINNYLFLGIMSILLMDISKMK